MRRSHVIAIDESFKEEVVMPVPGEDSSNEARALLDEYEQFLRPLRTYASRLPL